METTAEGGSVEELYALHHGALRRFLARTLRSEELAAEVLQDVFLRLLRFAPRAAVGNARAYLFQVAANAARDHLARDRGRERLIHPGPLSDTLPCPQPSAETAAATRQRIRILSEAVDALPPRCREVFLMSRLDGLGNGEIAARLGITRNMVEKHIIKAMLHCRRRIDASEA